MSCCAVRATCRSETQGPRGLIDRRLRTQSFDISELKPGIAWLTPEADAVAAIASIKIAIQHEPDQVVELTN